MSPADDTDISAAERTLQAVRREIDSIDDAMHDLLMKRANLAEKVASAKGRGGREVMPFRPGREAAILRRLVGRHRGPLPAEVVMRVWREIICALTGLQGPFAAVAYAPPGVAGYAELARDHFGGSTPLHGASTVTSVLSALERGRAQVAVLPLPEDCDDHEIWWRGLGTGPGSRRSTGALHILGRLPFLASASRGAGSQALLVGRQPFDPSGDDRGYLLIEMDGELSRARVRAALDNAGLAPLAFPASVEEKIGRSRAVRLQLVETASWAATDDPRLRRLTAVLGDAAGIRALGGYAQPIVAKRK